MITVRTRSAKEELSLKVRESGSDFSHNDIFLDDRKVGTISFSFYPDIRAVGIGNFEIFPNFRGQGLGSRVIKKVVNDYKSKFDLIYCFVDSTNEKAIKLYKRLGKVFDQDGPNDNNQYYIEFYNNGIQIE